MTRPAYGFVAGVVHEDVEAAEAFDRRLDSLISGFDVAGVCHEDMGVSPDLRRGRGELVELARREHHLRAGRGVARRDGEPDAL